MVDRMKNNKILKNLPIENADGSVQSVIGLYEMLAQAQPEMGNEHETLSDQAIVNSLVPPRLDE